MKFFVVVSSILAVAVLLGLIYRDKLIHNLNDAWRFWSMRLAAFAVALQGFVTLFPDAALQAWALLPPELKTFLPPRYLQYVTITVLLASMGARVVKQKQLAAPAIADKSQP